MAATYREVTTVPDDSCRWNFTDYADYLHGRGYAFRTVREYTKFVRRLMRWCDARGLAVEELTPGQMAEWASTSLRDSWASRKQAHAALKHFAAWWGLPDSFHLAVPVPRKPRRRSRALSERDTQRLRQAAVMVGGNQGTATLCCLYTAARAGEVAGFRWDGWQDGRMRWWRQKMRDWHEVPVHPVLAGHLAQWRETSGAPSHYMFPGNNGRAHVTSATIWQWIKKVGSLADIEITPQRLRATALTTIVDATGNLRAAQEVAGHTDPEVTAGYTRVTDKMLAEAVASFDLYDGDDDEQ